MVAPDEGAQATRDDESMRATARRSNAACRPSDKPGLGPILNRAPEPLGNGGRLGSLPLSDWPCDVGVAVTRGRRSPRGAPLTRLSGVSSSERSTSPAPRVRPSCVAWLLVVAVSSAAPTRAQPVQPGSVDARVARELLRGEAWLARGRRGSSERAFLRALRIDPTSTAALRGLSEALLGPPLGPSCELTGGPDRATGERAARLLTALRAHAGEVPPALRLAEATALAAANQRQEALLALTRAPRLPSTELAPALDALALLAAEAGDAVTAEQALRLAQEAQPEGTRARRLARLLMARGDAEHAVTVLQTALGFEPNAIELHVALAAAQLAAGNGSGAEQTLSRVVARCPLRCGALLARVALEAGDVTLAARRAQEVLALAPGTQDQADADGAPDSSARHERDPRSVAGYVLGLALARQRQPEAARQALQEVLRRSPDHRGARHALRTLEPDSGPGENAATTASPPASP